MKKIVIASLFLFAVTACGPVNTVLMKNPETGDVRECKRDTWKNPVWQEKAVLDECRRKYEKAGYDEVK